MARRCPHTWVVGRLRKLLLQLHRLLQQLAGASPLPWAAHGQRAWQGKKEADRRNGAHELPSVAGLQTAAAA